jgi:tRNA(adenine34) deaminase
MASIWAGAGRDDVHQMYFEDRHLDTVDQPRRLQGRPLARRRPMVRAALYVPPLADVPILTAEPLGRLTRFRFPNLKAS